MVNLNLLLLSAVLSANSEAVLVQFTAQNCVPCQQMVPAMQRLEEAGYSIRQVDIDRHPQIARDWQVDAVPTFVLVRENREIDRIVGPASFDRLMQMFQRAGRSSPVRPTEDAQSRDAGRDHSLMVRGQSPDRESNSSRPQQPRQAQQAERTEHSQAAPRAGQAEQLGLAASVRIKVNDAKGTSFGTGTIVDTHQDEALVVTCGHLFRDSQGRGEILVELLDPRAEGRVVPGQVIDWDADDRDIALLVIRPGMQVTAAPVAGSLEQSRRGAAVFSIGCDHGGPPSVVRSRVNAIDRYTHGPNIVVAGQPVDGRSGGGLFNSAGELIGICNAADPTDDEGIYAGLRTIHEQLDLIGMSRIYQRSQGSLAQANTGPHPTNVPPSPDSDAPVPSNPPPAPNSDWTSTTPPARPGEPGRDPLGRPEDEQRDEQHVGELGVPLSDLVAALENGQEVICIIRAPNQKEARVVFLDDAAREMLSQINPRSSRESRTPVADQQTASRPVPTQWRQ